MNCTSCGTKNNYYHRYCYYCGHKLEAEESPVIANESTKFSESSESVYPNTESNSSITAETDLLGIDSFEDESSRDTNDSIFDSSVKKKISAEGSDLSSDFSIENYEKMYTYLFGEKTDKTELNYQVPLRRYKKDQSSHRPVHLLKLLLGFLIIIGLAAAGLFTYEKFIKSQFAGAGTPQDISVNITFEKSEVDKKPGHLFTIQTDGDRISVLNQEIIVDNGSAQIFFDDSFLCSMYNIKAPETLDVSIPFIISKDGYPDKEEMSIVSLSVPVAPALIVQPSANEMDIEGHSIQFIIDVLPDSKLFINNDDYTDFIGNNGRFQRSIEVPEEPESFYEIRITAPNYQERIEEFTFRRPVAEIPLTVNQKIPVKAAEPWIEITGTTLPDAKLTVNIETKSPPSVDPETGEFSFWARAKYSGYTPFILTAQSQDKKDSSIEIILDRADSNYDKTAWKLDYDNMKNSVDVYNGQHFAFTGTIEEIIYTGDKNAFIVNTASADEPAKLIYVEYWGLFNFQSEKRIRIFGNRWGSENQLPKILAKFIY